MTTQDNPNNIQFEYDDFEACLDEEAEQFVKDYVEDYYSIYKEELEEAFESQDLGKLKTITHKLKTTGRFPLKKDLLLHGIRQPVPKT